jgi:molybdate transport system permease protein
MTRYKQLRARRRANPTLPVSLVVLALAGIGLFALPLVGLALQTPWSDLGSLLTSAFVLDALRLSVAASVLATMISVVLGLPIAFLLARVAFKGKAVVRALVLLPIVLPPVVGGAALLFALGRRGVIGERLYDATGIVLPFSMAGVVIAVTFVSMPFIVLTVEAALRNLDERYEGAAASLGASRWVVMRRVTLPMIGPSIASGLALTWARAFGEFGATITFAGNIGGRTQTMPLAVFVALESDRAAATALSIVMVAVALIVLVALRDRWWNAS